VLAREHNAGLEALSTLNQHAAPVDAVMRSDGFEGCELVVVDFDTCRSHRDSGERSRSTSASALVVSFSVDRPVQPEEALRSP
jgi:hypothetical protein